MRRVLACGGMLGVHGSAALTGGPQLQARWQRGKSVEESVGAMGGAPHRVPENGRVQCGILPSKDANLLRQGSAPFPCTHLGETGPLSQGVQARRKALRIRHINGMEVRKKRPGGFKKRPRGFKRAP